MFRCVFKDVLSEMCQSETDGSVSTMSSSLSSRSEQIKDVELSSLDEASSAANSVKSTSSRAERFLLLAKEVDAPAEFFEIAGRRLLGIHDLNTTDRKEAVHKSNMELIVDVMARAFIRCTAHADLVMMVLDDIHLLDELSWKVVKTLFEQANNLFLICASRPLKSYKIEVDPLFWAELHEVYTRELRFSNMFLTGLPEHEILHLISKRLGVRTSDIDRCFCVDLHAKSGGMPHFAVQMLDSIKRNELHCVMENGRVGLRKDIRQEEV
jgi:predicted ATPase